MSIAVQTRVWAYSNGRGSALLLLIAIADFADDNGCAFPSVETLAAKIRLDRRTTQRLMRSLEEMGELHVDTAARFNGCNLYRITPGGGKTPPVVAAPQGRHPDHGGGNTPPMVQTPRGGRHPDHPQGGTDATGGAAPVPPEPSYNHQLTTIEPSRRGRAKTKQAELGIDPTPTLEPADEIPAGWTAMMKTTWLDWVEHRRQMRKPMTAIASRQQIAQLCKWGEDRAIENIARAIRSGWQGIYDDRKQNRGRNTQTVVEERFVRAF